MTSCGIAIFYKDRILICHPTGSNETGTFTIPKGKQEENETFLQTALRETKEEIGLEIPETLITAEFINSLKFFNTICGCTHNPRRIGYFSLYINSLKDLGIDYKVFPKESLQLKEVDWAGFVSLEKAWKLLDESQQIILQQKHIIYQNGGFVYGPSHDAGGVKYVVRSTGKLVELEGKEAVLNDASMESRIVHKLVGTPKDIVNALNKAYDRSYKAGAPVRKLDGGESIINKKNTQSDKVYEVQGTPKEIASCINEIDGNGVKFREGDSPCKIKEVEEEKKTEGRYEHGGDLKDNNLNQNITKDEINNIISGTSSVAKGATIQAALLNLRGKKRTGSASEKRKSEQQELIKFIDSHNLWYDKALNSKNFIDEGTEQKVYEDPDSIDFVVKTNNIVFYDNWEEYFKNLLLHNYFFPNTAYELIGFKKEDKETILPVVRQQYIVKTEPTNLKQVENFLLDKGFVKIDPAFNAYKNKELGITIADLHAGNVLTKEGVLYFIDTQFFMFDNTMQQGGDLNTMLLNNFYERFIEESRQRSKERLRYAEMFKDFDVSKDTLIKSQYDQLNTYLKDYVPLKNFSILDDEFLKSKLNEYPRITNDAIVLNEIYYSYNDVFSRWESYIKKIDSLLKKYPLQNKKVREYIDSYRKSLVDFLPVAEKITAMKDRIVKRESKAVKEKERIEKIKGSLNENIKKELDKIGEDFRIRIEASLKTYYTHLIDRYKKDIEKTGIKDVYDLYPNREQGERRTDLVKLLEFKNREYIIPDNIEEKINTKAFSKSKEAIGSFIFKMTDKLGGLLSKMDKNVEVKHTNYSQGNLYYNAINFKFEDGSEFTVVNDIVFGKSMYGVPFYRYPTTFHNVTTPTGEKMKMPSEFKIKKAFNVLSKLSQGGNTGHKKDNTTKKITKDEINNIVSGKKQVSNGDAIQAALIYIRGNERTGQESKRKDPKQEEQKLIKTNNNTFKNGSKIKKDYFKEVKERASKEYKKFFENEQGWGFSKEDRDKFNEIREVVRQRKLAKLRSGEPSDLKKAAMVSGHVIKEGAKGAYKGAKYIKDKTKSFFNRFKKKEG